ncbi:MAG: rhomboid family intramembrane serine protease [Sulfolobales archaeon]
MGYVFEATVPRRMPLMTIAIVTLNAVVYIITSSTNYFTSTSSSYIYKLGYIPALLLSIEGIIRMFTSMFIHADLLHIVFNMYFLYVFGKGVEDVVGSRRFLLLYIVSGVGAALFHTASTSISGLEALGIPAVGASGAISGILGAYLMFFPGTSLVACFPLFLLPACFTVRASVYLVFWFAMQVLYGYMRIGGVAFFAHAGGFITGIAMAWVLGRSKVIELKTFGGGFFFFRRYIVFSLYREGLGLFTKVVLISLIVTTAATMLYYSVSTDINLVAVYSGNVRINGYSDAVLLKIVADGGYSYSGFEYVYTDIVLLRLSKIGFLVNPELSGKSLDSLQNPLSGNVEIRVEAFGRYISERVPVILYAKAVYDERGVARLAEGRMYTQVVQVSLEGRAVKVSKVPSVFDFSIVLNGPHTGEPVAVASIPTVLMSLVATYVVARKDSELSVS